MGEFDLIQRYFTPTTYQDDVLLGVGDDAAVVAVPPGFRLVAAVDTIVAGVHFPLDASAADIAWRALAVNLSDMAAMGAQPRWFTLSLCMPEARPTWLAEFGATLSELAQQFGVQLIGGDTVKGPLNISIQILGLVEADTWLRRSGAKPGDVVFVSGVPGEAASGLQLLLNPSIPVETTHRERLVQRFNRPVPRVELGRRIRTLASAAMDVSDGLLTDLRKLCAASGCGAHVDLDALPVSQAAIATHGQRVAEQHALSGGDDYELLFTVAHEHLLSLESAIGDVPVRCTPIGRIMADGGVQCFRHGEAVAVEANGFDHFAST